MTVRRRAGAMLMVVAVLTSAGIVMAQAVARGRVTRDNTVVWRVDASVPLTTVQRGEVLEVTGQSTNWFEVRLPERLAGRGAVGLIARSQLELEPGTPAPPRKALRGEAVTPAAQTPVRRPPTRRRFPLGYVALDVTRQVSVEDIDQVSTFEQSQETGEIRTNYSPDLAWGANVGFARSVWGPLAFGVAVEGFKRGAPAAVTASIPHPFFFGRPRAASTDITTLDQTQFGLHIQARGLWFVGPNLHVSVGGGPSVLFVKQGFVTGVTPAETYPYDVVGIQSVDTSEDDVRGFGFNVDGDVAYYFTRRIGVGVTGRFSQGDVTLEGADATTLDVRAGGRTVGVGLRVKF